MFFMRILVDLMGMDGSLVFFEYCEEYLLFIMVVGMNVKIRNYYKWVREIILLIRINGCKWYSMIIYILCSMVVYWGVGVGCMWKGSQIGREIFLCMFLESYVFFI